MCSLSYVHVYRIEYVSYRQGPYRIRIVSAADRIVPALQNTKSGSVVPRAQLTYSRRQSIVELKWRLVLVNPRTHFHAFMPQLKNSVNVCLNC